MRVQWCLTLYSLSSVWIANEPTILINMVSSDALIIFTRI